MTIGTEPGISVWWCERGHACFPRRFLCPVCRSTTLTPHPAYEGVVEEVTHAPATGIRMVTVLLAEGPYVLGRVGHAAQRGDRLAITTRAGVPGTVHVPDPPLLPAGEEGS